MQYHQVYFQPANKKVQASSGENLLRLAQRSGIHIDSSCGGNGSCKQCRIRIIAGQDSDHISTSSRDHFQGTTGSPVEVYESDQLYDYQLACRGCVQGDLHVVACPREENLQKHEKTQNLELVGKVLSPLEDFKTGNQEDPQKQNAPSNTYGLAIEFSHSLSRACLMNLASAEIEAKSFTSNPFVHFQNQERSQNENTKSLQEDHERLLQELVKPLAAQMKDQQQIKKAWLCSEEIMPLSTETNAEVNHAKTQLCSKILEQANFNLASDFQLEVFPGHQAPTPFALSNRELASCLAPKLHKHQDPWLFIRFGPLTTLIYGCGRNQENQKYLACSFSFEKYLDLNNIFSTFPMPQAGSIESVATSPLSPRFIITTHGAPLARNLSINGAFSCLAELYKAGMIEQDGNFRSSRTLRTNSKGEKEILLGSPELPAQTPNGIVLHAEQEIIFSENHCRLLLQARANLRAAIGYLFEKSQAETPGIIFTDAFESSSPALASLVQLALLDNKHIIPELQAIPAPALLGTARACLTHNAQELIEKEFQAFEYLAQPDKEELQKRASDLILLPE